MARYITAVVDLQYGSTGKGQIAGTVAKHWKPDTVVTAWGPNAGHTFRDGEFQSVSRMLASSAVVPSIENILIGPGSVLDLHTLAAEIEDRTSHLQGKRLIIHPQTTVLQAQDAEMEKTLVRIGSTMKGTAEAHIRKIRRETGAVAGDLAARIFDTLGVAAADAGLSVAISTTHYDKAIDKAEKVLVEGAQGFSLGYHNDFYPHCTGRDVSTSQLFADCRLPWVGHNVWPRVHVIGVCRTYPIRVANRLVRQEGGEMKEYSSGDCYRDQEETSWEALNKTTELTTVTKLPRRVFTFSYEQIRQAVRICAPSTLALTFCDYLPPDREIAARELAKAIEVKCNAAPIRIFSFGPDVQDVRGKTLDGLRPLLELPCDYLGGVAHDGY